MSSEKVDVTDSSEEVESERNSRFTSRRARVLGMLVVAGLVGMAIGLGLASLRPTTWTNESRILVSPAERTLDSGEFIGSTDLLVRRGLMETLAQFVSSDQVEEEARRQAGAAASEDITLESFSLFNSSVVRFRVTGSDPATVGAFAVTVGLESTKRFEELFPLFKVSVIDDTSVVEVSRPPYLLGGLVGAVIGLLLAASFIGRRFVVAFLLGRPLSGSDLMSPEPTSATDTVDVPGRGDSRVLAVVGEDGAVAGDDAPGTDKADVVKGSVGEKAESKTKPRGTRRRRAAPPDRPSAKSDSA